MGELVFGVLSSLPFEWVEGCSAGCHSALATGSHMDTLSPKTMAHLSSLLRQLCPCSIRCHLTHILRNEHHQQVMQPIRPLVSQPVVFSNAV